MFFQELPEFWNKLKKLTVVMKQNMAPLQAVEANEIRRKVTTFDVRQHEFREKFRVKAPFSYAATHPYVRIDRVKTCYIEVGLF